MHEKIKNMLNVLLPTFVLVVFSITSMTKSDQTYSMSERRVLKQKPTFSIKDLENGNYMSAFEEYMLDQFPARDFFRTVKAITNHYGFGKKDNQGLYMKNGYLSKLEYPMKEARLEQSLIKQQQVYDKYLKDTACNLYECIIPDKNYFLASQYRYPIMDYEKYVARVKKGTAYARYIDIFDILSLVDYYKTDPHWRQECLEKVVERLGENMQVDFRMDYKVQMLDRPFLGAYYNQVAIPVKADTLCYITSDLLEACTVTSYNTGIPKASQIYDMEKAYGKDSYEMFLEGSDAFLTIENPYAKDQRELVIFRDSFGSSLTPLLVPGYSKITLIDLRYVKEEVLGQLIEFDKQDVLFLYSSMVF